MLINLEHLMIVLPRLGRHNWYSVWPQAVGNRDCVSVCVNVQICVHSLVTYACMLLLWVTGD